jgi:TRAP-type C4-dicarboxylate transport system permease small subunit
LIILIKKLNRIEEWTAGAILLGLAVLTFIETVLRYTVSYTFPLVSGICQLHV